MDINVWTVSGHLTRDAESKAVGANGTALVTFSIAVNSGYGNNQKAEFVTVNLWGKLGQNLLPYLLKGKYVCVSGQHKVNRYTSQTDGMQHTDIAIDAKEVVLLPSGGGNQNTAPQEAPTQYEDIPY